MFQVRNYVYFKEKMECLFYFYYDIRITIKYSQF